jgi:glucan phosphoethanolaminetransferase (alkaline phosphatase superfamily)
MIQRQQTLWLLLAAVGSFLSFQFPFYTGNRMENNSSIFAELEAGSTLFLLLLTGISTLTAIITIFLYKERKTQLKMAVAGFVLSIILLILYLAQVKQFDKGNFALTSVFVAAIPIGYIMAIRGIWKDEKLVKSLDKLR